MKLSTDQPPTRWNAGIWTKLAGALTLAAIAGSTLTATAQVRPTHRPEIPNFDLRTPATLPQAAAADRNAAQTRLSGLLPSVAIDFDPLLQTPSFIRSTEGFLTGPEGKGVTVPVQTAKALLAGDPNVAIKSFLNEHAGLFGYDAGVLDRARTKRDYVDAHNGMRTVVWEQQLDGIPVFQSTLIGHVTRKGELVSLASLFVPSPAAGADAGTPGRTALQSAPPVSAAQAIATAVGNLGAKMDAANVTSGPKVPNDGDYQVFKTPDRALARLVWLPLNRSSLRLAWEVMVTHPSSKEFFQMVVDAQTRQVYLRHNLSCYISDATYNIYPSDSPSPFSPGLQTPGNFQPPLTSRTIVTTTAYDTNASPEGWIPDGGNTTTGNNADAFVDRNFDQQPDQPRPVGNPNRVFDFPLDLTLDPTNYIDASTVELFYHANLYHDKLYQLGFTEAAGNYQENNFGRGGLGNDNIICYVQSGADVGIADNSMFGPAPDGFHGQCYMFIFDFPTPNRDGALDQEVVYHEMTHGTSWRLVGGGMALGSLQGDGMGEGWSDFYALCLLGQNGDNPNAAYASGGYASYLYAGLTENYYFGIRHYPYCTDMRKNPFTFKDIDPAQISAHPGVPLSPLYPFDPTEASEVHHQGEVWCVTLWEIHANLVAKYGWTVGNQLMLQLATDGLKLTPALPTFLQARDAILQADLVDNGGANQYEIWKGFAKRGMGVSARAPDASTTSGVIEGYDIPGLLYDHAVVLGGNGNGIIDINECDSLQIYVVNKSGADVTNVVARLSTTTPGVIVTHPQVLYPPIPNGTTNVNSSFFTFSVAPTFICGTPISFNLSVKSEQGTSTNQFSLPTGVAGAPLRFDSSSLVPIPDNGQTNSIILVSNVDFAITKMTVSLHINHTYDADLVLKLVSPDGTTNLLSNHRGFNGDNYGVACAPDIQRTTFDDGATNLISNGSPPFLGSYQPEQALALFAGKAGTAVNGPWQLVVADTFPGDTGSIQCWSLILTPTLCVDGGGECPGADLALGMTVAPEPAIVSGNMIYTIAVTNNGPSTAKSVSVSQVLPSSVIFVSAVTSQGSASQAGGVVTANLGQMAAGGTATLVVTVIPTSVGVISASATVTSEQPDFDLSNNSVTVFSHVNPPTADLAVGISASPNSLFIGGNVTYTISLTNSGPSDATGVTVTNVFPAGMVLLGETVSQGSLAVYGNVVVCTFGSLPNGGLASATVNASPAVQGTLVATSTVIGNQVDPVSANNVDTAVINVGPASDLAIGVAALPNPAVIYSNLTFVTGVTNLGPSLATNTIVNETLPTGINIVSITPSQGTYTLVGSALTWSAGNVAAGSAPTLTVVVTSTRLGTLTMSANATAALTDPNPANNAASVSAQVTQPFVSVVAAGTTLTAENFSPPDGSIEPGERVTIQFRLQNVGNVANTNLVATLLPTGGVTAPSSPANYGILRPIGVPGGVPVARAFSFTASPSASGTILATLQLQDGPNTLAPVTFTFALPTFASFSNTNTIAIPNPTNAPAPGSGIAYPYPSTITVSGLTGQVGRVTATFIGLSHTYPHDINALLVGPTGAKTILMSHVADFSSASDLDLTFDDSATAPLPASGGLSSGAYQPAAYAPDVVFSNPAPVGPYAATMATFSGLNPNGTWSLYILDDNTGDEGFIANGWTLDFTNVTPVNAVVDLSLLGAASANSVTAGNNLTYTFTITNQGPNSASGVTLSNLLPNTVSLVTASSSQGNCTVSGNLVLGNLGNIPVGSTANVTITVNPSIAAVGFLTNTATVRSFETDLHLLDNTASVIVGVGRPLANLGLSLSATASPVTIGSNLTYSIVVTNGGPEVALNVVITDPIPGSASFVSAAASQGSAGLNGGSLVASLGDVLPGGTASVTLVIAPHAAGTLTNTASAATASNDSVPANNTATVVVTVIAPAPNIVAAAAFLVSENLVANGAVDPGETVTISFALANTGSLDTADLVAALQLSGGVTAPTGPASYGVLVHGGAAVARSFTFTASPAAVGAITATLQLTDGASNLGSVNFTFILAKTSVFSYATPISIPDHGPASPYPASIPVSGLTGIVSRVTAALNGLTHSFASDVNALLVGPEGQNVLLMSHNGGSHGVTNVTLTFDDAASTVLPAKDQINSGTYQPSRAGASVSFPALAPPSPYGSTLAGFNGTDPNGVWSLYLLDDSAGDSGSISSGWSLNVTTVVPLPSPAILSGAVANGIFQLTVTGQPGQTYLVQASTNFVSWVPLGSFTAPAGGTFTIQDTHSPGIKARYYRTVRQTP